MITIIDGLQLSGKSTLIEQLKNHGYKSLKFNFSKYSKIFNVNENPKDLIPIKYFQIGKDLALLSTLKEFDYNNSKIVLDRGIFSTIYYSFLYNRMSFEDIDKLFDIIQDEFKNFQFVFIIKTNWDNYLRFRNKNDGYDFLDKVEDTLILKYIQEECERRKINFKIFENDFNESIELNGLKLQHLMENDNEHIRS